MPRSSFDSDSDRERSLDRDASREPFTPRQRPQLTGRGTLQALLLERTETAAQDEAVDLRVFGWRPSDRERQS